MSSPPCVRAFSTAHVTQAIPAKIAATPAKRPSSEYVCSWTPGPLVVSSSGAAGSPLCADDSCELGSQNFYCDSSIVLDVLREVDGRHPARAELALDAVAIRECSGESLNRVDHRAQCVTKDTCGRSFCRFCTPCCDWTLETSLAATPCYTALVSIS